MFNLKASTLRSDNISPDKKNESYIEIFCLLTLVKQSISNWFYSSFYIAQFIFILEGFLPQDFKWLEYHVVFFCNVFLKALDWSLYKFPFLYKKVLYTVLKKQNILTFKI